MALSIFAGDLYVNGNLTASSMTPSSSSVTDTSVAAASNIAASKLEHQHELIWSQAGATTGFTERRVVHIVKGATADLVDFRVGSLTIATGTGSATINLHKNGTTILTAPIVLDSSNTNYITEQPAGYTSTTFVTGDVVEVVVSAVAVGTGAIPVGLFGQVVIREKAQ